MNATMTSMEWRIIDTIYPDQLEIGDNVYSDGIVEIIDIFDTEYGITANAIDEYGDVIDIEYIDGDMVDIFMLFEEE